METGKGTRPKVVNACDSHPRVRSASGNRAIGGPRVINKYICEAGYFRWFNS